MAETRAHPAKQKSELKNLSYEIFIAALSVLSIVDLVLVYAFQGNQALQMILSFMNALFSLIFLGDFAYRIFTAPSAARYFFAHFGWADLLASLPLAQLKILRVFRLVRVYRLMRNVGPKVVWNTITHDRANSTLMTLLLMGVLVLQFGSIWILRVEQDAPGANITSASDALWYTIVTISTVGYGDQYPVSNVGRLIGTLIIVVGVGIFGTFTGYLANLFLGPRRNDVPETPPDAGGETKDASAPALPPVTAEHTAKGVAAGAVSGAVTAGAAAPARGALPPAAELALLLQESERITARLRELVDLSAPGAGRTEP